MDVFSQGLTVWQLLAFVCWSDLYVGPLVRHPISAARGRFRRKMTPPFDSPTPIFYRWSVGTSHLHPHDPIFPQTPKTPIPAMLNLYNGKLSIKYAFAEKASKR